MSLTREIKVFTAARDIILLVLYHTRAEVSPEAVVALFEGDFHYKCDSKFHLYSTLVGTDVDERLQGLIGQVVC